ncbi:hypothetical protein SAY87_030889 [Trapa incisa]|uniref:FLZ-type domain-containing protein n=1 Tax=Trapa incisa TaxID=236973 RepID=A0AAN7QK64_9MYRT|nr:hypothetical protein SAY87_030889 [Trapa incisa]
MTRSTCFAEEDDGLASLVDMEAGFSGKFRSSSSHSPIFSWPICSARGAFGSIKVSLFSSSTSSSSSSSSISPRLYDARYKDHHPHQPHFLESCFLCKKTLGNNRDIFMYRGDMAFCRKECRHEQIDMDEAKEKNLRVSVSSKAPRKKDPVRKSNSAQKVQGYAFHISIAAAAAS